MKLVEILHFVLTFDVSICDDSFLFSFSLASGEMLRRERFLDYRVVSLVLVKVN